MVDTDTFRFDSSEMFAAIRKTMLSLLPANNNYTQNLIDSKDDMIYAWNPVDCCVLALNWRMAKAKEPGVIKYQVSGIFVVILSIVFVLRANFYFILYRQYANNVSKYII